MGILSPVLSRAIGRVLRPIRPGQGISHQEAPWTPAKWFLASEQGIWLDPSDMSTLFQDSAGTTPVTAVEQPVGLVLDKSQGLVLGSELVANGTFDAGTTGWIADNSASLSVVGQKLRVQHGGGNYPLAVYNISTVAGKTYRIHFSVTRGTSPNGIGLRTFNLPFLGGGAQLGDSGYKTTSGDYVCVFEAVSSTSHIYFIVNTETVGTYDDVDNVSIREIPGNHASQPTTASRPVLSARKNLLTKTENLTSLFVSATGVTLTNVNGPDGSTNTALRIVQDSGASTHECTHGNTAAGVYSFYIFNSNWRYIGFALSGSLAPTGGVPVLDTVLGVIKGCDNTAVGGLTAGYVEVVSPGVFLVTVVVRDAGSLLANRINPYFVDPSYAGTEGGAAGLSGGGLTTFTGDGTGEFSLWHPQAEYGSAPTDYQWVNTAADYDTVGFPHYLKFDGVDAFLVTGNIDFTVTHEMTVVAGVQSPKTSQGMLLELGSSYDSTFPSFVTFVPNTTDGKIFAAYHDTEGYGSYSTDTGVAINANVIAYSFDTAATTVTGKYPRFHLNGVNGISTDTSSVAASAAFINAPLYIGRRAGTHTPFLGNLYQLVVRGALTADLAPIEAFTADKTGVTLP